MSVNFNCRYCAEYELSDVPRRLTALYQREWLFHTLDITRTAHSKHKSFSFYLQKAPLPLLLLLLLP